MADPFEAYLQRTRELIATHGWMIQGVFPTTEHPEGHRWCYTVGLWERFEHPELAIFGISSHQGATILNSMGRRIRDDGDEFVASPRYPDIIEGEREYTVGIVDVPTLLHKEFFGLANRHYRKSRTRYHVRQVVWPDVENRLPWEPGFTDSLREIQPVLDQTFADLFTRRS